MLKHNNTASATLRHKTVGGPKFQGIHISLRFPYVKIIFRMPRRWNITLCTWKHKRGFAFKYAQTSLLLGASGFLRAVRRAPCRAHLRPEWPTAHVLRPQVPVRPHLLGLVYVEGFSVFSDQSPGWFHFLLFFSEDWQWIGARGRGERKNKENIKVSNMFEKLRKLFRYLWLYHNLLLWSSTPFWESTSQPDFCAVALMSTQWKCDQDNLPDNSTGGKTLFMKQTHINISIGLFYAWLIQIAVKSSFVYTASALVKITMLKMPSRIYSVEIKIPEHKDLRRGWLSQYSLQGQNPRTVTNSHQWRNDWINCGMFMWWNIPQLLKSVFALYLLI